MLMHHSPHIDDLPNVPPEHFVRGVGFAYLADVIVDPGHRGTGLGKPIVRSMIDEGPGSEFRWTLFTADAHGVYEQFGFQAPDQMAMVRPSTIS